MDYALLGAGCTILGLVISWLAFRRNEKKASMDEGEQTGTILTELGYIKGGIDDIKTEQRDQRRLNSEVRERLAAVEASAKQAHRRIDRMEGRAE